MDFAAEPVFSGLLSKASGKVSVKKIYLIRHGQTDFNVRGIVQGSGIDSSLNDTGRQQAARFFAAYKHVAFDKVYTSALRRTQESVRAFLDLGLPHEQWSALNEISWGTREGTHATEEDDADYHRVLEAWRHGNTAVALEGGETPDQLAARQRPFIDEVLRSRPAEETILVSMHGRAMRALLCQLLHYPLGCMDAFEHQNLCLYLLHYTGSLFAVRRFQDVGHLT